MEKKKVEVELLPWRHKIDLLMQQELIAYIRKLPKNSVLAVELSPGGLLFYNKITDLLAKKKIGNYTGIASDDWAAIELLHECRKRNIRVIPIETPYSRVKAEKAYKLIKTDPHKLFESSPPLP